jgi:hypothetical protein
MESFDDILSEADVDTIHAYVVDQASKGYNEQEKSKAKWSDAGCLIECIRAIDVMGFIIDDDQVTPFSQHAAHWGV